jgi:hypothetical protein
MEMTVREITVYGLNVWASETESYDQSQHRTVNDAWEWIPENSSAAVTADGFIVQETERTSYKYSGKYSNKHIPPSVWITSKIQFSSMIFN